MRARLRSEDGFALPLAISVMLIIAAFGAVAIVFATHNVERSSHDRLSARAQAAADAGADAAAYRMSRMLLASKIEGLLDPGLVSALQSEVGCLGLSVGGTQLEAITLITNVNGCTSTPEEEVDAEVLADGVGKTATFRYWVKNRANVIVEGHALVERQIISAGIADGVVRRISATYRIDLEAPATSLVQRTNYASCTAVIPPVGQDPATGCPS